MTEEFNLSEKIRNGFNEDRIFNFVEIKYIRKFIRRLKEEVERGSIAGHSFWFKQAIDKLAGEKLI